MARVRAAVCIFGFTMSTATAGAQDGLSLEPIVAVPGQRVSAGILARTSMALTGLEADIEFPSSLCGQLTDQTIEIAGRTRGEVVPALLEAARCPQEGRTSVILMDLRGDTVLPAGDGPIAVWTFSLDSDALLESTPLGLRVNQARSGPTVVEMSASGAELILTRCTGDCDGDNSTTVDEIVRMVNIALGTQSLILCRPGDTVVDGQVTVDEIVTAVNNALGGCPS